MQKLNNKLLTAFLVTGILFFGLMIYIFISEEILPNIYHDHTVNLNSIKVVRNDFFDTTFVAQARARPETFTLQPERNCTFSLVNTDDKNVYVESQHFFIKSLKTPETFDFYNQTLIPQKTVKVNYKLLLI